MAKKLLRLRVVIYAPHFAEYSFRMATALSAHAKVLLVVDKGSTEKEIPKALLRTARKAGVRFTEFERLPTNRKSRIITFFWVPLRIRLFFPNVAHVQEYGDEITSEMLSRLRKRVPVTLTVHDPEPHTGSDSVWFHKVRPFLEYMRNNADGLHVHGPYCEASLRRSNNIVRPLLSTPLGVLFIPSQPSLSNRRQGRILFFGRMEAYKGLSVFLDALDVLRQRGQKFEAVIAGSGPELDAQAERISATSDIQLYKGFLSPAKVTELFQSCCFVVAPYTDATQSGIVAAAFGNGRPVVATRVGGLVDVVTDRKNGLLVPPNSPQALADACQELLASTTITDELSIGADLISKTDLSWEAIALDVSAFYRKIVVAFKRVSLPAN